MAIFQFFTLTQIKGLLKGIDPNDAVALSQVGVRAWDTTTTFALNDFVIYNGNLYKSLQNNNTNQNPETATTFWQNYTQFIADAEIANKIGSAPSNPTTSTTFTQVAGATSTSTGWNNSSLTGISQINFIGSTNYNAVKNALVGLGFIENTFGDWTLPTTQTIWISNQSTGGVFTRITSVNGNASTFLLDIRGSYNANLLGGAQSIYLVAVNNFTFITEPQIAINNLATIIANDLITKRSITNWNSTFNYSALVGTYAIDTDSLGNAGIYKSLQNASVNVNQKPSSSPTFWQLIITSGGSGGTGAITIWSATTTYNANDFVIYNGIIYISLQSSNTNQNPATATTFWQNFTQAIAQITADLEIASLIGSIEGAFNFQQRTAGVNGFLTESIWDGTRFVAIANENANCVYSTDGVSWLVGASTPYVNGGVQDFRYGNGVYLASDNGGRIFKSTNITSGGSWTSQANTYAITTFDYDAVNLRWVGIGRVLGAQTFSVYTSTDGLNWTAGLQAPSTPSLPNTFSINKLNNVDGNNRYWFGGSDGYLYYSDDLLVWFNNGLANNIGAINSIDTDNYGNVYGVSSSSKLVFSDDNGVSWAVINLPKTQTTTTIIPQQVAIGKSTVAVFGTQSNSGVTSTYIASAPLDTNAFVQQNTSFPNGNNLFGGSYSDKLETFIAIGGTGTSTTPSLIISSVEPSFIFQTAVYNAILKIVSAFSSVGDVKSTPTNYETLNINRLNGSFKMGSRGQDYLELDQDFSPSTPTATLDPTSPANPVFSGLIGSVYCIATPTTLGLKTQATIPPTQVATSVNIFGSGYNINYGYSDHNYIWLVANNSTSYRVARITITQQTVTASWIVSSAFTLVYNQGQFISTLLAFAVSNNRVYLSGQDSSARNGNILFYATFTATASTLTINTFNTTAIPSANNVEEIVCPDTTNVGIGYATNTNFIFAFFDAITFLPKGSVTLNNSSQITAGDFSSKQIILSDNNSRLFVIESANVNLLSVKSYIQNTLTSIQNTSGTIFGSDGLPQQFVINLVGANRTNYFIQWSNKSIVSVLSNAFLRIANLIGSSVKSLTINSQGEVIASNFGQEAILSLGGETAVASGHTYNGNASLIKDELGITFNRITTPVGALQILIPAGNYEIETSFDMSTINNAVWLIANFGTNLNVVGDATQTVCYATCSKTTLSTDDINLSTTKYVTLGSTTAFYLSTFTSTTASGVTASTAFKSSSKIFIRRV